MNNKNSHKIINILSYAIPVVVALLLGIRTKIDLGIWTKALPHLNAIINFSTSILLIIGLIAIKNKKIELHRASMLSAFGLGSLFLISYVLYHLTNASTKFGGEGIISFVYYFLLISHIVLAAVVVRFVLMALFYALTQQIELHKKTVKYAFPIWLYVSTTGVLVYLMISPYYT
jgi:putative membrane protein